MFASSVVPLAFIRRTRIQTRRAKPHRDGGPRRGTEEGFEVTRLKARDLRAIAAGVTEGIVRAVADGRLGKRVKSKQVKQWVDQEESPEPSNNGSTAADNGESSRLEQMAAADSGILHLRKTRTPTSG